MGSRNYFWKHITYIPACISTPLSVLHTLTFCVSGQVVIVWHGSTKAVLSYVHAQMLASPPIHHCCVRTVLHAINPLLNAALLAIHCGNADQLLWATTGQDALYAAHVRSPWGRLHWHSTVSSEAALGWESSPGICGALCRAVQFTTRPLMYRVWTWCAHTLLHTHNCCTILTHCVAWLWSKNHLNHHVGILQYN